MTPRARFAFAAALFALGAAAAAAGAAPSRDDPKGVALLERVHNAYLTVPAVAISLRLGSASLDFRLALRSGIGVAEQVVTRTPSGTTTIVARRGGASFVRNPGRSCWRRLNASDPQKLADLGQRFPFQPGMRVKAPLSMRAGWRLNVVINGQPAVFLINRESLLVRSIRFTTNGQSFVEHVSALRSAPRIAVPSPRC